MGASHSGKLGAVSFELGGVAPAKVSPPNHQRCHLMLSDCRKSGELPVLTKKKKTGEGGGKLKRGIDDDGVSFPTLVP